MDFYTRYAAYQAAIEQYLEGLFSTDKPCGTAFWAAASASARC